MPVRVFSGASKEPPPGARAPVRVPSIRLLRTSHIQTGISEMTKHALLVKIDFIVPSCLRFTNTDDKMRAVANTGPTYRIKNNAVMSNVINVAFE